MRIASVLRVIWTLPLAFIPAGMAGMIFVIAIQLGQNTCMGVFSPLFAAHRVQRTASDRVARVLSAWSASNNAVLGIMTGLWGVFAGFTGPRAAIVGAGAFLLLTPFLLPWRRKTEQKRALSVRSVIAHPARSPE